MPADSACSDDRGQTPHDFALGVGVFLLTVAFVFATLPGLVEPFETDVSLAEETHADRVAAATVDHLSGGNGTGALDPDATAAFFADNASGDALRGFFGLAPDSPVNVSVRNGSRVVRLPDEDGDPVALAAGDSLSGRAVATTTRVVSFEGDGPCARTCRLVVEVG